MSASSPLSNRVWWIALSLVLIGIILWWLVRPNSSSENVSIGERAWRVEVADTEAERGLGLGERDTLCSGCGMLFVFPQPGRHGFWMKGMRFSLDIIFIADGKVQSIERRVGPDDTRIFTPSDPVEFVLEVGAGEADSLTPGMPVRGLP